MSHVTDDQRNEAVSFLRELARRASADDALDEQWWMALEEMLHDGWVAGNPATDIPKADTMSIIKLVVALHDAGVMAPGLEPDGVRITVELIAKMQDEGFRFQLPESKAA